MLWSPPSTIGNAFFARIFRMALVTFSPVWAGTVGQTSTSPTSAQRFPFSTVRSPSM